MRIVTALSCSVSKSTVMQNGAPIVSWRPVASADVAASLVPNRKGIERSHQLARASASLRDRMR